MHCAARIRFRGSQAPNKGVHCWDLKQEFLKVIIIIIATIKIKTKTYGCVQTASGSSAR